MKPAYQGSRSPVQNNSMPFYNPQKDVINPNNPILYQNNTVPVPGYPPNTGSKSFITRSNILQAPKSVNLTSNYLKNNNEAQVNQRKFNNPITSPTSYTPTTFPNYQQGFPGKVANSQMVKSSFHQNKGSESSPSTNGSQMAQKAPFISNTPPRRQPRMSEGGMYEPGPVTSFPKDIGLKQPFADKSHESPLIKKPKEHFENNFFKNKANEARQPKEGKEGKFQGAGSGKGELFGKSSLGKKRPITVNDFRKIKDLGSGKYGKVSLCQQKNTGFICALKMIEKKLIKEEQIVDQFIRELKIQMYLNHANIIKMYGFFDDANYIYIILEVGTGGQLYHQLKKSQPMTEQKVAAVMKQVCEAVNEIHTLKIIHRDIKPENIVLHDNVIKLCDFGWSVYQDSKLRTTFCGTPIYVSPEILKGKEYDEKIDIWSLGIMMYEMLVGENPFKITKEEQLIKIVKDEISIPSYVFVSREGRDFLDKCLRKNPDDRVSIRQLCNHDFIVKNAEKEKQKKMVF